MTKLVTIRLILVERSKSVLRYKCVIRASESMLMCRVFLYRTYSSTFTYTFLCTRVGERIDFATPFWSRTFLCTCSLQLPLLEFDFWTELLFMTFSLRTSLYKRLDKRGIFQFFNHITLKKLKILKIRIIYNSI